MDFAKAHDELETRHTQRTSFSIAGGEREGVVYAFAQVPRRYMELEAEVESKPGNTPMRARGSSRADFASSWRKL